MLVQAKVVIEVHSQVLRWLLRNSNDVSANGECDIRCDGSLRRQNQKLCLIFVKFEKVVSHPGSDILSTRLYQSYSFLSGPGTLPVLQAKRDVQLRVISVKMIKQTMSTDDGTE